MSVINPTPLTCQIPSGRALPDGRYAEELVRYENRFRSRAWVWDEAHRYPLNLTKVLPENSAVMAVFLRSNIIASYEIESLNPIFNQYRDSLRIIILPNLVFWVC